GGKLAGVQAHQDDDRQKQGADAAAEDAQSLLGRGGHEVLSGGHLTLPAAAEEPHHTDHDGQIHGGGDAGHEHGVDGRTGGRAVHDHGHGGGHDGGHQVGAGHQGGGLLPVVAGADHHGDQHGAQGRAGGHGGAHQSGKDQAGEDGHVAQAAADAPQEDVAEI